MLNMQNMSATFHCVFCIFLHIGNMQNMHYKDSEVLFWHIIWHIDAYFCIFIDIFLHI